MEVYEHVKFRDSEQEVLFEDFCNWIDQFQTFHLEVYSTKIVLRCSREELEKMFENYVYLQYLLGSLSEHFGDDTEYGWESV